MPGPPPPPPPSMGGLKMPKAAANPDDRGMLLQSIRQGAKLKKTNTVDKSGPYIPGKETTPSTSSSSGTVGNGTGAKASPAVMNGGPPGLAGLFAGGMPKLRPTGMGIGGNQNAGPKIGGSPAAIPKSPANPPSAPKSVSSTLPRKFTQSPEKSKSPSPSSHQQPKSKSPSPQMEQARVPGGPSVSQLTQVLGQALMKGNEPPKPPENRSMRGPPPQPPTPNRSNLHMSSSSETTVTTSIASRIQNLSSADSTPPPVLANTPSLNISSLQANRSSLHGTNTNNSLSLSSVSGSSVSLNKNNQLPSPTFSHNNSSTDLSDSSSATGKVINYGKPNVAPKPPSIVMSPNGQINNGQTPQSPKKQPGLNGRHASRSQSVRVPRSPPVTPPCPPTGEFSSNGFAPLKLNAFHQSQDSIDRRPLPTLAKNTAPQPPLSGSRTLGRAPTRPPAHCPPPPPPSRPLNQPPPPPPHRQPTPVQHTRSNSSPSTGPPQPPIRNSSMRSTDLDNRFVDKFHCMDKFPFPDAFLRIEKTYSSVNNAAATVNNNIVNKQQAPMPPITQIQLTQKLWANNSSNC